MKDGIKKLFSLILASTLFLVPVLSAQAAEVETFVVEETVQNEQFDEQPVKEEMVVEPVQEAKAQDEAVVEPVQEAKAQEEAVVEPVQESSVQEETTVDSVQKDANVESSNEQDNEVNSEVEAVELDEQGNEEPANDKAAVAFENENTEEATETHSEEQRDTIIIDTTTSASSSVAFSKGYAEVLKEAVVYSDQNATKVLGILHAGIVEVTDRVNAGSDNDCLLIKIDYEKDILQGYVGAEYLRPCTSEEIDKWKSANDKPQFELVEQSEDQESDISKNDDDAKEEENLLVTEAIHLQVKEEAFEPEDELFFEEEIEFSEDDKDLLKALPTDYQLIKDQEVSITVGEKAGAQAYAYYDMETSGLLTINFKSSDGKAFGNISITVKDADDNTLFVQHWSTDMGSVSFSAFVEAGEYTVIVSKSDVTDTNSYTILGKAIESRTGEAGNKNITANNAVTITVGDNEITGIQTAQDVISNSYDFYKFNLSEPGWVTLNYTNMIMSTLDFFLYGDDATTENQIVSMNITVPACSDPNEAGSVTINRSGWLDAGVYFIAVGDASTTGRYRIKVSSNSVSITENEKNNSFALAVNNNSALSLLKTETIKGLLSESNGYDCYYFEIKKEQSINIRLLIEFAGIDAAIYTRDGTKVSGSDFGATSTSGSSGNPYELELRNCKLEAGYYFLGLTWDSSHDCGLYSIQAERILTASDVLTFLTGATLKMTAVYAEADRAVTTRVFDLYRQNPVTGEYEIIKQLKSNSSDTVSTIIPGNGAYQVHLSISDGANWASYWKSFGVDSMVPLSVETVTAKSDQNGIITINAILRGTNQELVASKFELSRNGSGVFTYEGRNEKTHKFTAPTSATYDVKYSCTVDNIVWETGTTQVVVTLPDSMLPLSFSKMDFNVSTSGAVKATVTQASGKTVTNGQFEFYQGSTLIKKVNSGASLSASTTLSPGTYSVQYSGYNGVWANIWGNVTVPGSSALTVSSLTAVSNTSGVITITSSTTGGKQITSGTYTIYSGSTVVKTISSTAKTASWQAPVNGTYSIQYSVFDGVTWANRWTSVEVNMDSSAMPISITSLSLTTNAGGAVAADVVINAPRGLKSIDYTLYMGSTAVKQYSSATETSHVFYASTSGTYKVEVIAKDKSGAVATKSDTITVTVTDSATAFSVTNLTATPSLTSLVCKAETNDARAITGYFILYQGSTIVEQHQTNERTYTFTGLSKQSYSVQFTATDGKTWSNKWASAVVGSSLSVDSVTATRYGDYIDVTATVTNTDPIKEAIITIYDGSTIIASYKYSGTGEYLTHTFNVGDQNATSVQYTVFDGMEWKNKWASIT